MLFISEGYRAALKKKRVLGYSCLGLLSSFDGGSPAQSTFLVILLD